MVRDFLTPNGYWHPKSLKRLRKPPEAAEKAAGPSDSIAAR
jgi:hypothetical protein